MHGERICLPSTPTYLDGLFRERGDAVLHHHDGPGHVLLLHLVTEALDRLHSDLKREKRPVTMRLSVRPRVGTAIADLFVLREKNHELVGGVICLLNEEHHLVPRGFVPEFIHKVLRRPIQLEG